MAGTEPVSAAHAALHDQVPESQQIWGRGQLLCYFHIGSWSGSEGEHLDLYLGYQVLLLNSGKGNNENALETPASPALDMS